MENLLKNIEILREQAMKTSKLLNIERKKAEAQEKKALMNQAGFWNNQESAVEVSRQAEELQKEVDVWEKLIKDIRDLEELVAEGAREEDSSIEKEANAQYKKLKEKYEKLEFYVLFSGKHDESNSILSIHAGTGGVDAQDWAEILMRMYLRFCEKMNWQAEIIDKAAGNEAGIKSATLHIKGRWSYGYLKSEAGVHRLVRISPFDSEAMRHTSFALVEVIPELPETKDIEIKESEIRIDVYRSSGPGGQGVNTTDSAVRILHLPSNISVSCQNERSQHQNKETALKILRAKLHIREEEKKEKKERQLRGEAQKAEWGKQIRSYVMQPYKLVKDHRSNYESQDIASVLDGRLEEFMEAYLRWIK